MYGGINNRNYYFINNNILNFTTKEGKLSFVILYILIIAMKKVIKPKINYWFILIILFSIPFFGVSQEKEKRFTLLSSSYTGVHFNNSIKDSKEANILLYANFYGGAGVGVGDFNSDGLQDLYFAGNLVADKLYLNQGNLTFKDVTQQSGINNDGGWSTGVTVADVNNDGYLDIYVSRELYDDKPELRANLLYINKGDGTFIESAEAYGLNDSQRTRHSTFLDYNKDGFLDLFLLTQPPNPGGYSKFSGTNLLQPEYHIKLLKNTGKNTFVDVSQISGVQKTGFPNGVSASDVNNDGWTDIYVANDFAAPDFLFINNQDGTFTNTIDTAMDQISYYSMGVDIADINNDGLLDIFVVDMAAEDNFRSKSNMSGMNPDTFWKTVEDGGHYQYMYNALQLNNGNGTFSDIAQLTGMSATDWSWANLMADFDNDGLKDTYITNGLLRDIRNTDADKAVANFINKVAMDWVEKHPDGGGLTSIFDIFDLDKVIDLIPSMPISNYAFKNMGNLNYNKVMDDWGLNKESFSNGASYADLDNDGDLDLVVNNINEEAFIYRNNSESIPSSNFIRLQLSDVNNKTIFGTRITLYTENGIQTQETTNVRGIYSTSEPDVHFGIGSTEVVDSIVVTWPNSKLSSLYNPKINQTIKLSNEDAIQKVLVKNENRPIFSDYTADSNIKFTHIENEFDDYNHQVLLPHKMSQFGPALAVGDVNNDGLEDAFFGGAVGHTSQLFKQTKNGDFALVSNEAFELDKKTEDIDAVFFDVDNDGDNDLYVVSGGNEFLKGSVNYKDRLYLNDGDGNFTKSEDIIDISNLSGGVVVPSDFDNDGDIDLFVGTRHTPHEYPLPDNSKLLENIGGKLVDITNTKAADLNNLGLVTDAIWTDYDNDNDLDLMIVGEWMSITILKNENSMFTKQQAINNSSGWWFSIEQGDFDKDGDMDYIAGNLGLNYKYKTSSETPFDVYYKDFDGNGRDDIVLGYYNYGTHYPLRGFSCSSQQIPSLKKDIKKYDVFASLDLEGVYGKSNLSKSDHYDAKTFASSFIENLGNGNFKISQLPVEAQFSSVNDIIIDDFNNDSNLDVLLAGNLYVSEIETPRNDASFGLLLLGNGANGFKPLDHNRSGFFAKGDVKKLKTIKNKNQELILVAKNDSPMQVFKIND